PVTTTLADLAREIGATADEISQLSAEARQLTKGQLLALWGATSVSAAIEAYEDSHEGSRLPSPATVATAADVPLHLTLQDVSSIQQVFTPERVQAALGSTGTQGGAAQAATTIACCSCPCCTSGSMLENPDILT
ncbi:MAG: hypothetical protein JO063_06545, partial [Pseudonocardiales bacterium]|nr:hypothetical protein [Pseudonocardiales bacterium]